MTHQNNSISKVEGKKNLLKIEALKPLDISVCEDLTSAEQRKICGGAITGTGNRVRYSYR